MTTSKLTKTLDSVSDKAFGFKQESAEPVAEAHEVTPASIHEGQTEDFDAPQHPSSDYPTEQISADPFDYEEDLNQKEQYSHADTLSTDNSYAVPPIPRQSPRGHAQRALRTGPEQDFTVATVAGFVGILSLLLMFSNAVTGLLAIIFGATAVYFARKAERAGIGAGIGKTLGWFSFCGGVIALVAAAFFLLVAFVYTMMM